MSESARLELLPTQHDAEIASLLDLSAHVGRDPLLVQASNGNTSIKFDGVLWIKASGKCLANARQEEMFVPIELANVKESIRSNTEIAPGDARKNHLRPSIETAMHAVLRHRVVMHVHSINTIAWAIRADGPAQLKQRLDGLHWQWIPYASSGIPLAQEIEKQVAGAPETDVLILGNHGLVICGDDCEAVETLLQDVERRLAIVPRSAREPEAALFAITAHSAQWRVPKLNALHALGMDPISRRILKGGVLYPCQAVFLGPKIRTLPHSVPLSRFIEYSNGRDGERMFVIVEGGGVILNNQITSEEEATLVALMQVLQRTEQSAPLRYLTAAEILSLSSEGPHPYLVAAEAASEARETSPSP